MNISKYTKHGKNIVIELHNGVEYLIDTVAESALKSGASQVELIRLYDSEVYIASADEIEKSLLKEGVIDYLNKRP